jgi:hypothetical protein
MRILGALFLRWSLKSVDCNRADSGVGMLIWNPTYQALAHFRCPACRINAILPRTRGNSCQVSTKHGWP